MATGSQFTTASPTVLESLLVQMESRVRIGTERLYGSLETTSAVYTDATYGNASIGLVASKSFDLGYVDSLGIEITNEQSEVEAANVLSTGLNFLTGESAKLSVGIKQYDPRVLKLAMGTGVLFDINGPNAEKLITVGGACSVESRPVEVSTTNIYCGKPATPGDTTQGISAIVVTFYDMQCTSGLPWSEITAGGLNKIDLEFTASSVSDNPLGNRLLNFYIF